MARASIFATGSTGLDQAAEDLLSSLKSIIGKDDYESDDSSDIATNNTRPLTAPSWISTRVRTSQVHRPMVRDDSFELPGMVPFYGSEAADEDAPATPQKGSRQAAKAAETCYPEELRAAANTTADRGDALLSLSPTNHFAEAPSQRPATTAGYYVREDWRTVQQDSFPLQKQTPDRGRKDDQLENQLLGYKKALATSQEETESLRARLSSTLKELELAQSQAKKNGIEESKQKKALLDLQQQLRKQQQSHETQVRELEQALEEQRKRIGSKAKSFGGDQATLDQMREQVKQHQDELHRKNWELIRLESEQERTIDGYTKFLSRLSNSSARPTLDSYIRVSTLTALGRGNYGFVMTAISKNSTDKLVLKLLSPRWVHVAVEEWMHGSEISSHPNIVDYKDVLMHEDEDQEIKTRLKAAFESGALTGKKPKVFPTTYICCILEFMDRGTVQNLMNRNLIGLQGVAAITRQVASALAFMHLHKRTHNDIKPENILLRQASNGPHLIVKLADFGLAVHSVDRKRDFELFGYTIWCMGLQRQFDKVPPIGERKAALAEFQDKEWGRADARIQRTMNEVLEGIWFEKWEMQQVADHRVISKLELTVGMRGGSHSQLEDDAVSSIKRRTVVAENMLGDLSAKRRQSVAILQSAQLQEQLTINEEASESDEDEE